MDSSHHASAFCCLALSVFLGGTRPPHGGESELSFTANPNTRGFGRGFSTNQACDLKMIGDSSCWAKCTLFLGPTFAPLFNRQWILLTMLLLSVVSHYPFFCSTNQGTAHAPQTPLAPLAGMALFVSEAAALSIKAAFPRT